ncbi:MAG: trypsin-like serine peptidase [Pikeienuella sp.]
MKSPILMLLSLLLAVCATYQAAHAAERRYTNEDEARRWRAVGILRVGEGMCSGSLIAPDLVLTVAHCVANAKERTQLVPSQVVFYAGWRNGDALARRRASKIGVHPGYFATGARYTEKQVRVDVAYVRLAAPIAGDVAPHFDMSYTPRVGSAVALLSYAGGRWSKLSVQAPCRIIERKTEFLRTDCLSQPGASGSPIVETGADGVERVVGLNTGLQRVDGEQTGLGLSLAHVRDWLSTSLTGVAPPTPEVVQRIKPGGVGNSAGFKRVKP